jgi:uncharacterized protein YbjT (DUF2867 family)
MRVCVVGATGVIGRSLVPLLLGRGHDVLALARSPERASPLSELLSGCSTMVHAATSTPRDFAAPGASEANTRLCTGTRGAWVETDARRLARA